MKFTRTRNRNRRLDLVYFIACMLISSLHLWFLIRIVIPAMFLDITRVIVDQRILVFFYGLTNISSMFFALSLSKRKEDQ